MSLRASLVGVSTALLLAVTVSTAHAADAATITLTPDSGIPGTAITVDGAGFCSVGCSAVTITFDTNSANPSVPVNDDGTFHTVITAPGGAPAGTRYVTARQTNATGGEITAQASFTYRFAQPPTTNVGTSPTDTTPPPAAPPANDRAATSSSPESNGSGSPTAPTATSSSSAAAAVTVANRPTGGHTSSAAPWIIALLVAALGGVVAAFAIRRRLSRSPH